MNATLAVGFFDGVHLGHRAILKGADIALTFENHPLSLLSPQRAPRLIMSSSERAAAIRELGVKATVVAFDAAFANSLPERFLDFLTDLAATHGFGPSASLSVRCGASWRFGKGGCGDASWLRDRGIDVTVVPAVEHAGAPISSTRIRAALETGSLPDANAMLGRPFVLRGTTFRGKGAGASLGFPTLNVRLVESPSVPRVRLPRGAYEVRVAGEVAVANYGVAPTFGDGAWTEPVVEVHFLGKVPEIGPDVPVTVAFARFLRPERKFASVAQLREQIAADCAKISV